MRFGFITAVRLGQACLEVLFEQDANVVYMGTLQDHLASRKSGRVYLDNLASEREVPLHKFTNVNDADALAGIRRAKLDWLFIIGWSQIAGSEVLSLPKYGVLGMHPTLLPQGRGRASIPWAIIKGLPETGVSMFKLDEGTDTGPLVDQKVVPIDPDETATTLYDKVALAHQDLMRKTYPSLRDGTVILTPQNEALATEWPGRSPQDGYIDPRTSTVADIDRMVRALTRPYPGAFIGSNDGTLRVWAGSPRATTQALEIQAVDGTYYATDYELEV